MYLMPRCWHYRRRVSNLLQSGFRENLDQLIQSYMDRRSRNPVDWEEHETYSDHTIVGEDTEQQDDARSGGQELDAVESPRMSLPSQVIPIQPRWDHDRSNSNWPAHDLHQGIGMVRLVTNWIVRVKGAKAIFFLKDEGTHWLTYYIISLLYVNLINNIPAGLGFDQRFEG